MEGMLEYMRQGLVQQGQVAVQNMVPFSTQIIVALFVFFITRLVASRVRNSVAKGAALAKADAHAALLVSRSAHIGIWCLGVLMILGVFGIGWTAIAATLGVVGLAVTVSLQDVLKNFVAGVYILIERPFRIGDVVRVKEHTGAVEDVRFRTTHLRTADGSQVIIPNATIFVEVVVKSGAVVATEVVERK